MNFKDLIEQDIAGIFFNLSEFAEVHNFNGRELSCVVDEDKFQKKTEKNNSLIAIDGIFKRGMTLYINKRDLPVRPHSGEVIEFDGQDYTVAGCKEDLGVIELDVYMYDESGGYNNGFY